MKVIHTHKMNPEQLKPAEREFTYNGLDCMVTLEVLNALLPQLDDNTSNTYSFSRSLQGPVLEMSLRGVRVDLARKAAVIEEYYDKLDGLEQNLERIVREGIGYAGFNWRSNDHLKTLFYDKLGIPVIRKQGRPTVDRSALEKLEAYIVAKMIVRHLISMRELGKRIQVLKTDIDPDGRMRTSYNIAGTETGRFSSSFSEFGTGGNLQNIEESLRSIFIADEGMKMAYLDAAQGESRVVGAIEWNIFGDGTYLDACEGGDLHTTVARLCWPDLPWTNDLTSDKELAEQPYYRHYSRRFMCKKIGHGSNYGGKPFTLASQAKVETNIIEDFQPKYFKAFPAHLRWHQHVEHTLKADGMLISLTGRRRHFFGRRDSGETLREAIAYDPQGSLADIVNNGMLSVWHNRSIQLLMQQHDAVIVQYPEHLEDELIPVIQKQLIHLVELLHDRTLIIPYDCKTGWNFSVYCCGDRTNPGCDKCERQKNLDGLKSYKPNDQRSRAPQADFLDRIIRRKA